MNNVFYIYQYLSFVYINKCCFDELLSRLKFRNTGHNITHSLVDSSSATPVPPSKAGKPLVEVGHIQLHTAQLVVVMETSTAPENACVQVAVQEIDSDVVAKWDDGRF